MKVLLDTNLLTCLANGSHPYQKQAKHAVEALFLAGYQVCIVPQNLYEFWVVATCPESRNGLGMSVSLTNSELTSFKTIFSFAPDTPSIYGEWEKLVVEHAISGKQAHDSRLVAAMIVQGITHLLTLNTQDFRRYSEIVVLSLSDVLKASQTAERIVPVSVRRNKSYVAKTLNQDHSSNTNAGLATTRARGRR